MAEAQRGLCMFGIQYSLGNGFPVDETRRGLSKMNVSQKQGKTLSEVLLALTGLTDGPETRLVVSFIPSDDDSEL